MTPAQQIDYLRNSVLPRLSEAGFEAFVLTGYIVTETGKTERVCIAHLGQNPAYEDGLRPVIGFAHMWGATPPQPPKREEVP